MNLKASSSRAWIARLAAAWCVVWVVVPPQLSETHANPSGGTVTGGSATISQGPGQVTVNQSSHKAVVNWRQFSINQGETTTFVQPNSSSATLNRVTGGNMSQIHGSLNANGKVYLVNPQGVVVGKTGRVNTGGGFTASTLDVSDQEFLAGKGMTFKGSSSAPVINQGKIRAANGDVTLIARQVENHGKISAKNGQVALAGGSEVLVMPSNTTGQRVFIKSGPGSVANSGTIRATAAELRAAGGNEYALAVNNTGVIRATKVDKSGGRIVLKAESGVAQNSGSLIARGRGAGKDGGRIDVTGQNVRLTSTSRIDARGEGKGGKVNIGGGLQGKDASVSNARVTVADAGSAINVDGGTAGGTAILWSDEATGFYGDISAKGPVGAGGFVETSSHGYLDFRGTVDTAGGSLLLDPSNITITTIDFGTVANTMVNPYDVTSTTGDTALNAATLTTLLLTNNVFVHTSGAYNPGYGLYGTGTFPPGFPNITGNNVSGDIAVSSNVLWNSPYSLTLAAHNDIIILADIINSYTGAKTALNDASSNFIAGWSGLGGTDFASITANPANYGQGTGYGLMGSIYINYIDSNRSVNVGNAVGDVRMAGYDMFMRGSASTPAAFAQVGYRGTTANSNISLLVKNILALLGGNASGSFVQIGHGGSLSTMLDALGNINVSQVAAVGMMGGSGSGSYVQIGHGGLGSSLRDVSGDILISSFDSANPGMLEMFSDYAAASSYMQIGHGGLNASLRTVGGEDGSDIVLSGFKTVKLTGGTNANTTAQIGHGGTGFIEAAGGTLDGDIALKGTSTSVYQLTARASGVQIGHGGKGAQLQPTTGKININGDQLVMNGGTGQDAYIQVGHGGGSTTLTGNIASVYGGITLRGFSLIQMLGSNGLGAYLQLGHGGLRTLAQSLQGNIVISGKGASSIVLLRSGMNADSYAQIGHGGALSSVTTAAGILGDITVQKIANLGILAYSSYGQVGHAGNGAYSVNTAGNILVDASGEVLLLGGGSTAQIGHGGVTSGGPLPINSTSGSIWLRNMSAFTLVGGANNDSYAIVGHGGRAWTSAIIDGQIAIDLLNSERSVFGETSLVAGTGPTWANPIIGHRGNGTFTNANILLRTGTLDSAAATMFPPPPPATMTTVNQLLANIIRESNHNGDFTLVSGSIMVVNSIIGDTASPYTLSLLSMQNLGISASITNTGTGDLYMVSGYDGTSGTAGAFGNPNGVLTDKTAFLAPAINASEILFMGNINIRGNVNMVSGGLIDIFAGSVINTTGKFLGVVDNLNATAPAYSNLAVFRNNGSIFASQAQVFSVSAATTILGNLFLLPSTTGIWYGMPGALDPGVNYKLP
ncbi:MAG: filamentous hemagglutinin N-terminal domain-containing protein [Candidatus Methylacidiphilales bacterium]